jgi:hypothetical protein
MRRAPSLWSGKERCGRESYEWIPRSIVSPRTMLESKRVQAALPLSRALFGPADAHGKVTNEAHSAPKHPGTQPREFLIVGVSPTTLDAWIDVQGPRRLVN